MVAPEKVKEKEIKGNRYRVPTTPTGAAHVGGKMHAGNIRDGS